jgi:cytochrome b
MNSEQGMADSPQLKPGLVWDWPTRCFHWLLAITIAALFISGKLGGNWMEWHGKAGYLVLGLVIFRLCWGVFGSTTARFASFVKGPKAIWAWLHGRTEAPIGHNPLGAVSVVAMIALIGLQSATGLFANDDIMTDGPYAAVVGKERSGAITQIHKVNSNFVAGLICLHLLAIAIHIKRKGMGFVLAMVTGRGHVSSGTRLKEAPPLLAIFLAAVVALVVVCVVYRGAPLG